MQIILIALVFVIIILFAWIWILKKTLQEHLVNEHALQYDAEHDRLTGLANGTLLIDRLTQVVKNATRYEKKVAVLYLDIDKFKAINDAYGFSIGDKVLQDFSEKLLTTIRDSDTVARLGGNEFIIILDHFEDASFIESVVQKIFAISKESFIIENQEIALTFSIGISVYPNDNTDVTEIINNASTAMRNVKSAHGDNYQFFTPTLIDERHAREEFEASLLESLEKNQMEIHYQFQIDSKNKSILGMEAFLRWKHPSLGLLLPEQFLDLAKEIDFLVDLEKWVLQESIDQFEKWHQQDFHTGNLSINLSTQSLHHKNFLATVGQHLNQNINLKEYLIFELSEHEIMQDPQEHTEILEKLSRLGIKLSLDDFGATCSSLSSLEILHVNTLKFDISTVHQLPKNANLVKSLISLAHNLSLNIGAVGVETKEQLEFLNEYNCSQIQGFIYHKPSPAEKIQKILHQKHTE